MSNTKAVREAKARLAGIEAQRAALQAKIKESEAAREPLAKKLAVIRAKRRKVSIISNTGGRLWFGSLGAFDVESYGLREAAKDGTNRGLVKSISDGLASGGLKVSPNSRVSLTLRGLAGRVRIPDKAAVAAWKRAVAASARADKRARDAQHAENMALQAAFDTAEKIPTDAILPDLVAEAAAKARLEAVPMDHESRQALSQIDSWEGAPLRRAVQHLKHAQSGSTEPCPCSDCARDRQQAIRDRDEAARRATLPTRLLKCRAHGRRRMAWETRAVRVDNIKADNWPPEGIQTWQSVDMGIAYCPKGDVVALVDEWLAARAKAKAAEAKAIAKAAKKQRPTVAAQEGETVTFTCPSCGSVATSEVYLDETDENLRVGCSNCEAEPLVGAIQVHRERKAA